MWAFISDYKGGVARVNFLLSKNMPKGKNAPLVRVMPRWMLKFKHVQCYITLHFIRPRSHYMYDSDDGKSLRSRS